jgi:homoserine O-acetyltransferase
MATYRSPRELAERFAGAPQLADGAARFPVEDYLEARGRAFASAFDPEAFLCLSQAIDLHCVEPRSITVPTTLVAVASDQLVPPEQVRALGARLAGPARLIEIDSRFGHDAFLADAAALDPILRDALAAAFAAEVQR